MEEFKNQDVDYIEGSEEVTSSVGEDTNVAELPTAETQNYGEKDRVSETLPDATSERTRKQFDKLKETNKTLSQQLAVYEQLTGAGTYPPVTNLQAYVDSEGNVDIERFNRAIQQANEYAQKALELAQRQKEDQEEREAYQQFAWLNPASPDYNPEAYDLVVDRLVRERFVEGKEKSLSQIAKEVSKFIPQNVAKVKEEAISQYKEVEAKKSYTSPVNAGKGQPRVEISSDELRRRTLEGDSQAIQERLRRSGY